MPKKTNPKLIRYEKADWKMIQDLRKRIKPKISAAEIQRRAVRFAVPKMLSGELPVTDEAVLIEASQTKRLKKLAVSA